jgi:hypothetical protein
LAEFHNSGIVLIKSTSKIGKIGHKIFINKFVIDFFHLIANFRDNCYVDGFHGLLLIDQRLISVGDPDPEPDPHVFGHPGSGSLVRGTDPSGSDPDPALDPSLFS